MRPFGRRVLEFPIRSTTVHSLACASPASPVVLKARFRHREVTSPSTYSRRFRLISSATGLLQLHRWPAGLDLRLSESGAG